MPSSLLIILLAASVIIGFAGQCISHPHPSFYKHVAMFSVDGLHPSDVEKYVALRPQSAIAKLLKTGYDYTNAYTAGPSDSFPGTLNQLTGASPRTTGVWYDDTWDRDYYEPGSNCKGDSGAEVSYAENIDYDSARLFSGGINPANLPKAKIDGNCTSIYPHQRLRVNTIFEVVKSKGKETAYTDKHPAYDLVRGPSGKGLSEGYFPEITALPNTVDGVITYDQYHVDAFLLWLEGKSPTNAEGSLKGVPTLFGGNFQVVNVGQKTKGYQNLPSFPFTPELLKALDFVDQSLGKIVKKLQDVKLYNETLLIVASKHGQAPINPTLWKPVDPLIIKNGTKVAVDWQTSDDIALLFLKNQKETEEAVQNLEKIRAAGHIKDIIWGDRFKALGYGDPKQDSSVPDIIVQPDLGVCYTTSTKKFAEHGGISDDDTKVSCFVSNPHLQPKKFENKISTRQIAPTVLRALGYDPRELKGVQIEDTGVLDGF